MQPLELHMFITWLLTMSLKVYLYSIFSDTKTPCSTHPVCILRHNLEYFCEFSFVFIDRCEVCLWVDKHRSYLIPRHINVYPGKRSVIREETVVRSNTELEIDMLINYTNARNTET